MFFKITLCTCVFEKSSIFLKTLNFQINRRQVTFLFLGLKVHFLRGWGGIKFEFWWVVLIFDQAPKMSLRGPAPLALRRARSASLMGWMGRDGWDGISKVSFNFLHTLQVYRSCIYMLIYIFKNCHQDSYGFKNLMSSLGSWQKFQN